MDSTIICVQFKDFPGKCWDPTTEKAYDFDEEFFLEGQCTRGLCSKGFTIQYHT